MFGFDDLVRSGYLWMYWLIPKQYATTHVYIFRLHRLRNSMPLKSMLFDLLVLAICSSKSTLDAVTGLVRLIDASRVRKTWHNQRSTGTHLTRISCTFESHQYRLLFLRLRPPHPPPFHLSQPTREHVFFLRLLHGAQRRVHFEFFLI